MGKGSNTTQTNSSSSSYARPEENAYQSYLALLNRAGGVADTPYQAYGGEQVAPINEQQQAGIGNINTQQGVISATGAPISAADIQRYQDPYTNQVIQATQADFDAQNARAQSQTTGNAAAQGALGGDRSAVAAALTAEGQSRSQAPVIAGLRSQGYQQAVKTAEDQQQQALRAGVAGLQGAQAQVGAGTLEQQTQQAQDTQGRLDYYQKQGYPFQVAQWLASIDTGVGSQMGGTSNSVGTAVTQGPTPNPFAQAAGVGLAAFGAFSDRRVKENIQKIGETNDGQPIYRFNYKGHPQTTIGLMHDEVEESHPEATGRVSGVGVVDYHKATDDSVEKFRGGRISGVHRFAEGGGVGDDYNTPLSPADERNFLEWKSANAPDDSGYDYDLRGAFRHDMRRDPASGHMGDAFKKPNHPTFSDQSQYAVGDQRDRAGHWNGEDFVPPAIKGVGGRVHGYAGGGSPWGNDQTWVPTVGGLTAGKGAPAAPSLPQAPSAQKPQGLSNDQMKGIGALGKAGVGFFNNPAYGGENALTGEWGGSSSSPLPGLSAEDYGVGFDRGGRVRRYANGGYAFGGAPEDDDPSFDDRFGAAYPNRIAAGVGSARPAFGSADIIPMPRERPADDEIVRPGGEPYRMQGNPDEYQAAMRSIDRDKGLGLTAPETEEPQVPEEKRPGLPSIITAGRSGAPEGADEGPSAGMGYAGRPQLKGGVYAPASTPEGAPDEGFLSRLGIRMTPELKAGLLQAGLSMMATRHGGSGSFLQAAGEAGMTGVGAYSQTQQLAQAEQDKLRKEGFEREKFERPYSEMTAAQKAADRRAKEASDREKVPFGWEVKADGTIAPKKGGPQDPETIRAQNEAKQSGGISDAAVEVMARQGVTGDQSWAKNIGRGAQGARTLERVRNRMADIMVNENGMNSTDAAKKISEATRDWGASQIGANAGARTRANREENLNLILKATDAAIPAALEASRELPRGQWVPINKIVQAGQVATSDPRLAKFGMANLQLAEHWARAMNPLGVMRESDRDLALKFLSTATSQDTYAQVVQQLKKQITRERDAIHGNAPEPTMQPSPAAIQKLQQSPDLAKAFDEKYGVPGLSKRYLGQ